MKELEEKEDEKTHTHTDKKGDTQKPIQNYRKIEKTLMQ